VVRAGKERPILWVSLGLIVIAAAGVVQLRAGNSMGAQFFEKNAPVRGFRLADSRLVGTRVIQVLIEGKSPDTIKDPVVLQKMEELSTFIQKQPLPIGKVVSIVDVLKLMSRVINSDSPNAGAVPASSKRWRSTCSSIRCRATTTTSAEWWITTFSARS
jgi:predicted RND superfamily exporter protein